MIREIPSSSEPGLSLHSQICSSTQLNAITMSTKEETEQKVEQELPTQPADGNTTKYGDSQSYDNQSYRLVILILGIVALSIVVFAYIDHNKGRNFPESLTTICATAIGALAGILIPQVRKN